MYTEEHRKEIRKLKLEIIIQFQPSMNRYYWL